MGDILGSLKFQLFFGVLEIPDILLGLMVDAEPEPTYEEKIRVPAPLGILHERMKGYRRILKKNISNIILSIKTLNHD